VNEVSAAWMAVVKPTRTYLRRLLEQATLVLTHKKRIGITRISSALGDEQYHKHLPSVENPGACKFG
jgi:hypothetical protein